MQHPVIRSRNPSAFRRACMLTTLMAGLLFGTPGHADLVVIVHPDAPVTALSKPEVARIFMKKSKTLPNGDEVIPLSQSSRPDVNERFFATITGQDRMQREAYWARLLFTGKGRPPEDAKNDKNVKERVSRDRRYIGYIDAAHLDKTVKAVYRLP